MLFLFLQYIFKIENTDGCKNNLEHSFTTKVGRQIAADFSMSAIYHLKTESKHGVYKGKDCMKKIVNY